MKTPDPLFVAFIEKLKTEQRPVDRLAEEIGRRGLDAREWKGPEDMPDSLYDLTFHPDRFEKR
jgi:hypothetical protein